MKVCFFSRCNLVYLYGALDKALSDKYDFVHVAYSDSEFEILNQKYNIPKTRITHFKHNLVDYLQRDYSKYDFNQLEDKIVLLSDERFNLNLSIQIDRGLKYKSYEESKKLIAALYEFWSNYFDKEKPQLIFHEMVSLSINHLCSVAAKERGIFYTNDVQVHGLADSNFILTNYWGGKQHYYRNKNQKLKDDVEKFIESFNNKKQAALCGNQFKNNNAIHYLLPAIKKYFYIMINKNKYLNLEDYIENFLVNDKSVIQKYKNLNNYRKIAWDKLDLSKKYYYYPYHLEPEAAVFYWGDGIYSNQTKLIENIASSLPPDTFLYVKDHPHNIGYRNVEDYMKLKCINNIKLLNAKESSYEVLKHSKGVITINGSAGFEALLLNKPVYYFGNPYYENFNNTFRINNIKDLRKILLQKYETKSNFDKFLDFFSNTYPGDIGVFYSENYKDVLNLKTIINSIDLYLSDINKKND